MVQRLALALVALCLAGCRPVPTAADAGPARESAPAPPPDPEVLRFDPGAAFRLRLRDARDVLRLCVVLRESRTGAALEVTAYPLRGARPRSDPPMVLARITPLTRAQVAAFWTALDQAGLWSAAGAQGTPESLRVEARLGGKARDLELSGTPAGALLLAAARTFAQVDALERSGRPRVAAIEGPPTESIAVVSDPTRVVLVQDSPDGARLTIARDGELVRVTRRLPLVSWVGRRHRRRVVQWLQRDRWLPADALEEALARAAAEGLWELPDPASNSPFATRLVVHVEGRDLALSTPPGPDPEATFRALASLRALGS